MTDKVTKIKNLLIFALIILIGGAFISIGASAAEITTSDGLTITALNGSAPVYDYTGTYPKVVLNDDSSDIKIVNEERYDVTKLLTDNMYYGSLAFYLRRLEQNDAWYLVTQKAYRVAYGGAYVSDDTKEMGLEFNWDSPTSVSRLDLWYCESVDMQNYTVYYKDGDTWKELCEGKASDGATDKTLRPNAWTVRDTHSGYLPIPLSPLKQPLLSL